MMAKEDGIRDMEVCAGGRPCAECSRCNEAKGTGECVDHLMRDALALLKGEAPEAAHGAASAAGPAPEAYDFWADDTD